MHNTWLIIRREYLERVRSKAFLAFTFLIPLFMYAIIILPSKLMSMKPAGTRHVVIVSENADLAQRIASEIAGKKEDKNAPKNDDMIAPKYTADVENSTGDATRAKLNSQID